MHSIAIIIIKILFILFINFSIISYHNYIIKKIINYQLLLIKGIAFKKMLVYNFTVVGNNN